MKMCKLCKFENKKKIRRKFKNYLIVVSLQNVDYSISSSHIYFLTTFEFGINTRFDFFNRYTQVTWGTRFILGKEQKVMVKSL